MLQFLTTTLLQMILDLVSLTAALVIHRSGDIGAQNLRLWQCSVPIFLLVKTTARTIFFDWSRTARHSYIREFCSIALTMGLASGVILGASMANLLDPAPPLPWIGFDCAISMFVTLLLRICLRSEPNARDISTNTVLISDSLSSEGIRKLLSDSPSHRLNLQIRIDSGRAMVENRTPYIRPLLLDDLHRTTSTSSFGTAVSNVFADKTVLITGAAGLIGAECCRQLSRLGPAQLLLVDQSELGLSRLQHELKQTCSGETQITDSLCNVTDQVTLGRIFSQHLPDIVIHAARYHDRTLMQRNIQATVRNNLFGTRSVVDTADRFGTEKCILVSSHPELHPSDIVAAMDRLSERYVEAQSGASTTQFMAVRIGIALGSSDCPTRNWQHQFQLDPAFHPAECPEEVCSTTAADLIHRLLSACAIGHAGQILAVADGPPINAKQLIRDAACLFGQSNDFKPRLVTTSGQSEFDGLRRSNAKLSRVADGVYLVEAESPPSRQIKLDLQKLERATHGDAQEVLRVLGSLVQEFIAEESDSTPDRTALLSRAIARNAA